jgi:hypothetical protein
VCKILFILTWEIISKSKRYVDHILSNQLVKKLFSNKDFVQKLREEIEINDTQNESKNAECHLYWHLMPRHHIASNTEENSGYNPRIVCQVSRYSFEEVKGLILEYLLQKACNQL